MLPAVMSVPFLLPGHVSVLCLLGLVSRFCVHLEVASIQMVRPIALPSRRGVGLMPSAPCLKSRGPCLAHERCELALLLRSCTLITVRLHSVFFQGRTAWKPTEATNPLPCNSFNPIQSSFVSYVRVVLLPYSHAPHHPTTQCRGSSSDCSIQRALPCASCHRFANRHVCLACALVASLLFLSSHRLSRPSLVFLLVATEKSQPVRVIRPLVTAAAAAAAASTLTSWHRNPPPRSRPRNNLRC